MTAPLSKLTSTKLPLLWTPEVEEAFAHLKELLSTSPVLVHPDTGFQLVVEVDASVTRVGAVLSRRNPSVEMLHPCTFFSLCLSPGDINYNVGNQEL